MADTGSMDDENGVNDADGRDQGSVEQSPIGGVVRDRRPQARGSVGGHVASRLGGSVAAGLAAVGLRRGRNDDGSLAPRRWKRIGKIAGVFAVALLLLTSVHIVAPGTVAVPVTLGSAGDAVGPGLRFTLPLTTMKSMSVRTQNYTMSAAAGEGANKDIDDSVRVLGADGGSAQVNATVLFRLDPDRAVDVLREIGTDYTTKIVRPSSRACIRLEFTKTDMVAAATTSWEAIENSVAKCMKEKIEPSGLVLQDFQLREIALSTQLQKAVDAKVAAQQNAQQQQFELDTSTLWRPQTASRSSPAVDTSRRWSGTASRPQSSCPTRSRSAARLN